MPGHRIFATPFAAVYPMYVEKAKRRGRTKEEIDRVIYDQVNWPRPYDPRPHNPFSHQHAQRLHRGAYKGVADMITVFGEGRGFRVVWLLEEMGLAYKLRPVDLLAGVENDAEFLAINPAGFIPAIQDGEVTMVESVAIMEYLMARYGPTPLAPSPEDPGFPAYQQFLHLGEAGLAASIYFVNVSRNLAPEAERQNWGARKALEVFESRLGLVTRQLARSPYLAGDAFTAADISVTYALELAQRGGSVALGEAEQAYVARTSGREGYKRAMETCQATRGWVAEVASRAAFGAGPNTQRKPTSSG